MDVSMGGRRVAERWRRLVWPDTDVDLYRRVIREFRPDLVHVHGTEQRFGLLAGESLTPVVLSIQGVMSVFEIMETRGRDASLLLSLSPSLFARGTGALLDHAALKGRARRERDIIQRCRHIIGRTRFDADFVRVLNPGAHYYHCDELIRPEFRAAIWEQGKSEPHTVYSTAGGYARKGMGTLLRATALLRSGPAPQVRLRFAGAPDSRSEEGRATMREIRRLGLGDRVTSLGRVGPRDLVTELLAARVFALPTHVDNSPNSLAEAMMVGTPCVASAAGGIPTLARDCIEALLVQDGDPYALAGAILRLLEDDQLALQLSANARVGALERHDSQKVREALIGIYRAVLDDEQHRRSVGGRREW
jgi:glycosyltransferase involved in cell wall biosynthesis